MKSMTGFGTSEYQDEQFLLVIDVKSYNNRYFDLAFNIPGYLACYEAKLKEMVKAVAARGHIEVNIRLKRLSGDADVVVDAGVVDSYKKAFKKIIDIAGLDEEPRLSHFLHADEVLKLVKNSDVSAYEEVIIEQMGIALVGFEATKISEGESTFRDILGQLDSFEEQYRLIQERAGLLEETIRSNLVTRFEELTGGEYDENRVLQEVAVLLMKYTVNEEISRIESHLAHFREEMTGHTPVGKRLDFLCQELNREINTIASKSVMVEVNQAVVAMKDSLENIREQLRNIE